MDEQDDDFLKRLASNPVSAPVETQPENKSDQGVFDRIFANPVSRVPHRGKSKEEVGAEIQGILTESLRKKGGSTLEDSEFEKEVVPAFRKQLPEFDPRELRGGYEQERRLNFHREQAKGIERETPLSQVSKASFPWASRVRNIKLSQSDNEALARYQAGKATDADLARLAATERLGQMQQEAGTLEQIGKGALHVPSILGEAAMGGKALQGTAKLAPGYLGWLAPEAAVAPTAARTAGPIAQIAGFAGRNAAQSALIPALYIDPAIERAKAEGGSWTDLKNLGPSFAMANLQNAVLQFAGSMGRSGEEGVKGYLQGIPKGAATGLVGQQVVDVVGSAARLETGYGVMGDIYRGDYGKALQHATVQASTFALYSALHGGESKQVMSEYQSALKELQKKGFTPDQAAANLSGQMEFLQQTLAKNPGLTREGAKALFKDQPDGPLKDFAFGLAKNLPEVSPTKTATVGERAAPPEAKPPVPEQGPTPEQARAAGLKEVPVKPPEQVSPQAPEPTPTPRKPFEGISEGDVRGMARSLGLNEKGTIQTVVRRMVDSMGEKNVWQLDQTLRNAAKTTAAPPVAPESPVEPPVPEPAKAPPEPEIAPPAKAGEQDSLHNEAHPATKALLDAFGTGRTEGGVNGSPERVVADLGEGAHALEVEISKGETPGTIRLDYGFKDTKAHREDLLRRGMSKEDIEKGAKTGRLPGDYSKELFAKLKDVIGKMKDAGQSIEYTAVGGRHGLYEKIFDRAGFEQVSGPTGEGNGLRVWRPRAAEASPVEEPAPAPEPAAPKAPEIPAHQHALEAVKETAGQHNFASIADVRDALAKRGITGRAEQDAAINEARRAGAITPSAVESNRGRTPEEMKRLLDASLEEDGTKLGFLSVKQAETKAPAEKRTLTESQDRSAKNWMLEHDWTEEDVAGMSAGKRVELLDKNYQGGLDAFKANNPPEAPPVKAETKPPFERLRDRWEGGEKLTLDIVGQEFGLEPREIHVVREHIPKPDGTVRSFKDIGKELGITRQRAQQIEKDAMAKMGTEGRSVFDVVHKEMQADAAIQMEERGQGTTEAQMRNVDPDAARRIDKRRDSVEDRLDSELDALTNKVLNGEISDDAAEAEFARINQGAKESSANKKGKKKAVPVPPAEPEAGQQAPVRHSGEPGIPESGERGAAPAPEGVEQPAAAQPPGTGEVASAARSEAAGNKLSRFMDVANKMAPQEEHLLPQVDLGELRRALGMSKQEFADAFNALVRSKAIDPIERSGPVRPGQELIPSGLEGTDYVALEVPRREAAGNVLTPQEAAQAKRRAAGLKAWETRKANATEREAAKAQWEGHAREAGVDPAELQARVQDTFANEMEDVERHNAFVRETMEMLGKKGLSLKAEKYESPTEVPNFDRVSDFWTDRRPDLDPQMIFDLLKEGIRKPPTEADFYRSTLDAILAEKQRQAAQPTTPAEVDASFDFGANLMDTLKDFAADESGALKIPQAMIDAARDKTVETAREVYDQYRELGGAKFPRTTRINRETAEAMVHLESAGVWAKMKAPELIDALLGQHANDPDAALLGNHWMTTMQEYRHRTAKAQMLAESRRASGEAAKARALGDTKGAAEWAKKATEEMIAARKVTSFIGKPGADGSAPILGTDADYYRALAEPEFHQFMERWKKNMVPLMEENYRTARGMEDWEDIHDITQIPDLPMNAKAVRSEADLGPKAIITGNRGRLKNVLTGKTPFAKRAGLDADAYDTSLAGVVENTLMKGTPPARKAELIRTAIEADVMRIGREKPDGYREHELANLPERIPDAKPGDRLWIKDEAYDEFRRLFAPDEPQKIGLGVTRLLNLATFANVAASLGEGATHIRNMLTMMFNPRMSLVRLISNAVDVIKGDKGTYSDLVELARIGAMKGVGFESESFLTSGKYNPLTVVKRTIDVIDRAMPLTAAEAYDKMVDHGLVPDTETGKRDFINQLGNYSRKSQHKTVALLRDTGLGPFATAGSNFWVQGLRAMTGSPGVTTTSWGAEGRLRVEKIARIAGVLGLTAAANYALWGRWDGDDNTPAFALKTGQDDGGKTSYFDMGGITGFTRGLRQTGALALLQGMRRDADPSKVKKQAARDIAGGFLHPMAGPGVGAVYTGLTGQNLIGRQVTDKEHDDPEDRVWAAIKNLNPTFSALSGAESPGKELPFKERAWKTLGSMGLKYREGGEVEIENFYDKWKSLDTKHDAFQKRLRMGVPADDASLDMRIQYARMAPYHTAISRIQQQLKGEAPGQGGVAPTGREKMELRERMVDLSKRALEAANAK